MILLDKYQILRPKRACKILESGDAVSSADLANVKADVELLTARADGLDRAIADIFQTIHDLEDTVSKMDRWIQTLISDMLIAGERIGTIWNEVVLCDRYYNSAFLTPYELGSEDAGAIFVVELKPLSDMLKFSHLTADRSNFPDDEVVSGTVFEFTPRVFTNIVTPFSQIHTCPCRITSSADDPDAPAGTGFVEISLTVGDADKHSIGQEWKATVTYQGQPFDLPAEPPELKIFFRFDSWIPRDVNYNIESNEQQQRTQE